MMGFTEAQGKELRAKLRAAHVSTREENGRTLSYLEGWHVIAEANRIFGFDGWDRETVTTQCIWSDLKRDPYRCVYIAKVRVSVRAGDMLVAREGSGSGEGNGSSPGEAHDRALKAAETDATKRALMTFGNAFGLALYDKQHSEVTRGRSAKKAEVQKPLLQLKDAAGIPGTIFTEVEAFGEGLGAAMDRVPTVKELFALWERNLPVVRQIGKLPSPRAVLAEKLVARFKARAIAVAEFNRHATNGQGDDMPAGDKKSIDKSRLAIAEPKRIRSKEHLRFVASQPCLICGRRPSQAHHLRFAQPRAMGRKVSDEFTVPLCNIHHGELHRCGDERVWWLSHNCDPLQVAAKLWKERLGSPGTGDETEPVPTPAGTDLPNRAS